MRNLKKRTLTGVLKDASIQELKEDVKKLTGGQAAGGSCGHVENVDTGETVSFGGPDCMPNDCDYAH